MRIARPEHWGLRRTLAIGLTGGLLLGMAALGVAQITWAVGPWYPVWLRVAGALMVATGFWSASWVWIAFLNAERRVREGLSLPRGIAGFATNCLVALIVPLLIGHQLHGMLYAWHAHHFTPTPTAELRLLPERNPDGSDVLELYGPMGIGTTHKLQHWLAQYPWVRTLQLDSPGGLAPEAIGVAQLIQQHQLDTAVVSRCEGACIVALAAGSRRLASPQAILRCHKPYMPVVGGAHTLTATDRHLLRWLTAQGVDPQLAQHCFQRPAWDAYTPDPEALHSAWLITHWLPAPQSQ